MAKREAREEEASPAPAPAPAPPKPKAQMPTGEEVMALLKRIDPLTCQLVERHFKLR